ncbi:uncharacterized protein LOC121732471 [Aricia agestis]|uniref:uncharacterized protein LOC121732471 n=1 Tax=Aricia agestis TaxID=91739 RepID=UPI001C208C64|nr:uncharacterized protein LOC121732471 [Aricia agestis]
MWTYDKVIHLIELFRARPLLWDTTNAEFKDGERKNAALEEIASALNITKKDVESKLHTIRSQFTRERKRIAAAIRHGVTDTQKMWIYYEPMQFLLRAKNYTHYDLNKLTFQGESSLCQSDMVAACYLDDSSSRLTPKEESKEESDNTSENFTYEFKAEEIDEQDNEEDNQENREDREQENEELQMFPFAAHFADVTGVDDDQNPRNDMAYSWTHDKVKRLIELLRSKPVLWDTTIKNYRSKPKRTEAFEEIARVLKITRKNVEAKVHGLRTQFVKERQKIATKLRSGIPYEKIIKWVFYERLQFLYSTAPRNKFDIADMMVDYNLYENQLRSEYIEGESTSEGASDASTSTFARKRRKMQLPMNRREIEELSFNGTEILTNRTEEDFLVNKIEIEELASSSKICDDESIDCADKKIKKTLDEMDSFDIYGAYVASELRSVNNAQEVTQAKYLINNILYELKMGRYKDKDLNADEST